MQKTVVCHDVQGNQKTVPAEELSFSPRVYGVIVQDGKVLLSPQWDGFDFPGGGVDLGETFEEALARELKEETGLSAEQDKLLHVTASFFIHPRKPDKPLHTILAYYSCKNPTGTISTDTLEEYEKAAVWMSIEEATTKKFYNPVDSPALIRMAVEGKGV